jgi:transcriptional regulator with XRE-family HTH domain
MSRDIYKKFTLLLAYMKKNYNVANRLRKLRGTLSQEDFSKKMGIPLRTYQYYESGERIPKSQKLSKIARLCDTTIDWILTGDLKIEKALTLIRAEESFVSQDFVKKIKDVLLYQFRLYNSSLEENASAELKESRLKISKMSDDELLPFITKYIYAMTLRNPEKRNRLVGSIRLTPLNYLFHRIENLYNKGEKVKIDAIKSLVDAFEMQESPEVGNLAMINMVKALLDAYEKRNFKGTKSPIEAPKKAEDE